MKYLLAESRIEVFIINYLYDMFDVNNMTWEHPIFYDDETGEEFEDNTTINFYSRGNYHFKHFVWFNCEFFASNNPDVCPAVRINSQYEDKLNGYFNDLWKEPFKKWFKDNFDLTVNVVISGPSPLQMYM